MARSLLFLLALIIHTLLMAQFNWQWARQLTMRRNDSSAIGELEVIDGTGRRVLAATINDAVRTINVADWPTGTYFVRSGGAVMRMTVLH